MDRPGENAHTNKGLHGLLVTLKPFLIPKDNFWVYPAAFPAAPGSNAFCL
jgi:hypothetical protein